MNNFFKNFFYEGDLRIKDESYYSMYGYAYAINDLEDKNANSRDRGNSF